ncbi:Uncharacterised protein [Chlamydia trachomatis]|nr:Uncharacterised protein [Chlamydia trachomatis]
MNKARNFPSENTLSFTTSWVFLNLLVQTLNLTLRQERKSFKKLNNFIVWLIKPELIEAIRAKHCRIKPHCVTLRFAKLTTLIIRNNRACKHVHRSSANLTNQVHARSQITPLIRTAKLQSHVVIIKQVQEVVSLQNLIAELSKRNAFVGV